MSEPIIRLLDQQTIDKIAAGEVVERPASVVKELVENSIDAGASIISIEIEDGGLKSIRISDNGKGIGKEDIRTAFLRHATSKLRSAEELSSIYTLGFRGEALSSISAVSMIELMTKTPDEMLGYHYVFEGGRELEFSEMGVPDGTTIFVRNIFYNTPARKKFLKSAMTEGSYIADVVERLALSHPEIAFRFISDKREKLHTLGTARLLDAIYQIYGREISSQLLELNIDADFFTVRGYIGKPIINRGNRAYQSFFVENRYIKSKLISQAIEEGYQGYIMGHQYPLAILFFSFDSEIVDVNVHPSKMEVRFEREREIFDILKKEVALRLNRREDINSVEIKVQPDISVNPVSAEDETKPENEPVNERGFEPFEEKALSQAQDKAEPAELETKYEQITFMTPEAIKHHRIIGQAFDTYWIVEYDEKLYIIDQHAAHEKVLYEETMRSFYDRQMTSQLISPGILLSLNEQEILILNELMPTLESIGFEIEYFGQKEYIVNAIPGNMYHLDPKSMLMELLDTYEKKGSVDKLEMIVDKVATISCKAAIKGNNRYSYAEMDELLGKLFLLDNPYHCPHGRPTMISFSKYELEKNFMRIV